MEEKTTLTRRRVLGAAAGAALGLATSAVHRAAVAAVPPPASDGDDFAFLLLGDLHFDRTDQHDMAWLKREKPGDLHQVENYSRITRDVAPGLLGEAAAHAADPAKKIAFTVHIGDFVEGLAGTPERARVQCRESLALLHAFGPRDIPFLFCKGNHDVTGPGAVDAWSSVLLPFITQQAGPGASFTGSCFTQRRGDSLFAYFDAYEPDASLQWLEETLAKRTEKNLFVVIHPPVVPYDARADWHLYAKPSEAKQREQLLHLLGKNRAIVLCGHLHKYGTVVRETPSGRFLQVATISVVPSSGAAPKDVLEGVERYGPGLVRLEPEFSPPTRETRQALLTAEKPFIRHFDYADAPGYGIVTVRNGKIGLDLYAGIGNRLWKTLDLSALLAA